MLAVEGRQDNGILNTCVLTDSVLMLSLKTFPLQ